MAPKLPNSACITVERSGDGIDVTITRPLGMLHAAYAWFMWTPGAALVAFGVWMLASNQSIEPGRKVLVVGLGLLPAAVLYGALGLMSVSGWSRTQRLRIRDGIARKQYPLGRIESFSLPVWTPLTDPSACCVRVEPHRKDSERPFNRPAFRDRLTLVSRGRKLLSFGPTLTVSEAELVADALNAYFSEVSGGC